MISRFKIFIQISGLMAAMTIGAGLFALPYIFHEAGWLTGLFYLFTLSGIVIVAHVLYLKVLAAAKDGESGRRLVGLAGIYFGRSGFGLGLVAVVGGLLFTLVVYLILGGQFMSLVFAGLDPSVGLLIFWLLSSAPFLVAETRFARLEFLGVILMTAIIALIYFSARTYGALFSVPAVNSVNIFLPFSAILFSLAAWPVLEPIYRLHISSSAKERGGHPALAITLGTLFAALLYFAFVLGIFGSTGTITEETVSGLVSWPNWKIGILGVLGLFAIWTSYIPIGFEISNSLAGDLKLSRRVSLAAVLFLPPLLIVFGLNNFLRAVGLAGGVFLSLQYLLIILVSQKALKLRGLKKLLVGSIAILFLLAAVYEVYYFVIQ
ncbi:MAG: aromatic amino acid transport family protein [Candidatus Liptonbacteria bacterium]|nr:aromatic amino acid transport family protein [Candidatus Liptonbacteria bacterium]